MIGSSHVGMYLVDRYIDPKGGRGIPRNIFGRCSVEDSDGHS